MQLTVGTKLGPYEILAPIGAGGMGEVYRARDSRLGREVAVKVSAQDFTERFEREARAIASLNHTNVCHIYDVGPNYLVMELVEGEALAGPLRFEHARSIIRQLIDGIDAAHERNIVHRDLKPANIKITPEGVVKILDFGLAKASATETEGNPETSPTITMGSTQAGTLLGTAAYMSPEQARGKTADKRSDIWSFGVVVYELLTGKKAFGGETVVETLGSVLNKEPDWAPVPDPAQRLLKWCLEKDRKRRLQAIGDARRVLEEAPQASQGARRRSGDPPHLGLAVAAVFAVAFGVLGLIHFREHHPAAELRRFQISLPPNETSTNGALSEAISPDGRNLAFETAGSDGKAHLWIRSLDSLDARELLGVEPALTPLSVFWSADSRSLAFVSWDLKLKKVAIAGGPPQTLCEASSQFLGGDWNADGVILFVDPLAGVYRISSNGGARTQVTSNPQRHDRGHALPRFLPDGHHFLYYRDTSDPEKRGIYVGSIDLNPAAQSTEPLVVNDLALELYVPSGVGRTGWLLFGREGSILAQPFDPANLKLSGDPLPVAEGIAPSVYGTFSASTNGILVFAPSQESTSQLTWLDRDGKNPEPVGKPGNYNADSSVSRDGKLAAVTIGRRGQAGNLWLVDLLRGGTFTKLTFGAGLDAYPAFSPDGSRVVFSSTRDSGNLYQKLTNGKTDEELLLKSEERKYPFSWSGHFLAYYSMSPKTKRDIWILPIDENGKPGSPVPFQGTEFNELTPQFSPDGRWIAYVSDEQGYNEVFVREFVLGSDNKLRATAKHQISTSGGDNPLWMADGSELIYTAPDHVTLMSAEITTKPDFKASPPKELFKLPAQPAIPANVSADGKRILVALAVNENGGPPQFTVIENWQEILK